MSLRRNTTASGCLLGGDPFNIICGQGMEQSERAPLLLLMEVRRDENGLDDKESSSEAIY
eukprot:scaffold2154_cov283-Chaetoceros_neogracile.AAC.2